MLLLEALGQVCFCPFQFLGSCLHSLTQGLSSMLNARSVSSSQLPSSDLCFRYHISVSDPCPLLTHMRTFVSYTGPPGNLYLKTHHLITSAMPFTMAAKTYEVRTQTSLGVTLLPTNKVKPLKAFEWRRASLTEGTTCKSPKARTNEACPQNSKEASLPESSAPGSLTFNSFHPWGQSHPCR